MSESELAEILEEAGAGASPAEIGKRLQEMIEAESSRAGEETPDDEPEPEPVPDDEPEPDNLRVAYAALLAEYLPPEIELVPCPVCSASPVPGALPFELEADPTKQRCRTCNGFGEVITGSLVVNEGSGQCPTCIGRGYEDLTAGTPPPRSPSEPADSELGYTPIEAPHAPAVISAGVS